MYKSSTKPQQTSLFWDLETYKRENNEDKACNKSK